MNDDHQYSVSESIDNRKEKSIKIKSKMETALLISLVWVIILAGIALAEPIYNFMNKTIDFVSIALSIKPSVLVIGAMLATYISLLLVFMQSVAFRSSLRRISGLILKSEKSFYLPRGFEPVNNTTAKKLSSLEIRIRSIEQMMSAAQPPSEQDWEAIKDQAKQAAVENLSGEISDGLKKKLSHDKMQNIWGGSLSRLSDQIIVLGSRANLTLWMGILFCIFGLAALWYSFFSASFGPLVLAAPGMEWVELAKSYAPRLTLVILIEIIGFFFLKMYRATLLEIRYVQNEITNVEMRVLALSSALSDSTPTLAAIIEKLAETDRNSIIEKGQTTVEIEKQRASTEADKTVFDAAVSLVHGNEKSSIWRRT